MTSQHTLAGRFRTHSAGTKDRLYISNVGRFRLTKLATAAIPTALALAALLALLLSAARSAQAQTVLYNFFTLNDDGAYPYGSLISDGAGNFYGTNWSGGSCISSYCLPPGPAGTVFELSPNGYGGFNQTVLYSFCSAPNCTDGAAPQSNLVFDSVGNLYGTTIGGGSGGAAGSNGCELFADGGCGVVFELSPVGTGWNETVLYSFCLQSGCPDGANPSSGLIFDRAGNLYGTVGNSYGSNAPETVFELSPSSSGWTEQVIYANGGSYAGLTMDAAGNIFGVTGSTVFELSPNGHGGWKPTVIYTFAGSTGGGAVAATPVLDNAGNLYGTTTYGGAHNEGEVYKLIPGNNGKWTEQTLHSFNINGSDGGNPLGGVALDAAGNIYGTTAYGGADYGGTVYELVAGSSYKEKILCSFNGWNGAFPFDAPTLDSVGNLYGTTTEGGSTFGHGYDANGFGVAFEVSAGAPTATTLTSSLNPSIYGQKVTWTATVTGLNYPTGKVNFNWGIFSVGSANLKSSGISGVATLTRSLLNADHYPLTAVYTGDANNGRSASPILNQVINQATSSATLTASPNPSTQGQSVTFTATITSPTTTPTGPVTFTAGKTTLGTVELSKGKATLTTSTLAVGSTVVTVTYPWNSNISGSSASVTQVVRQ